MAYTYLIGWSKLDKWYYGVRYAKTAHPSDLWTTYFTSSKTVKKFREEHGEPDIITIRKIFSDVKKVQLWEHKVLKRTRAVYKKKWLNKTDNRSIDPSTHHGWSVESRLKTSRSHTGLPKSAATRAKIKANMTGRDVYWIKGKKRPEHSKLMSGGNNPKAISVCYNGQKFPTIRAMCKHLDICFETAKKRLAAQNIQRRH